MPWHETLDWAEGAEDKLLHLLAGVPKHEQALNFIFPGACAQLRFCSTNVYVSEAVRLYDAKYVAAALPEVPPRAGEKLEGTLPDGKTVDSEGCTLTPPERGNKGCTPVPLTKGSEGCTLTPMVDGSEGCTLTPIAEVEDSGKRSIPLVGETAGPLVLCGDGEANVFTEKWIIDSGSAYDLMKKGKAEKQFHSILQDSGKAHFDTANGRTASMDRVGVFIEQMPVQIKPWLLEHTPLVLSLGKRCLQDGFDFVWKRFALPYFVTPNGTILPLDVDGMVPTMTSAMWEINGVVAPVLG